jgi:regulatory protein
LIITGIVKQKRYERYNIMIDGNFKFSASMEDIIKYSLNENMEVSENFLDEIINECEVTKAYNYALHVLGSKDYTTNEILKKLRQKEYSEETINKIICKLKNYGIVDDEKYINKYVSDCLNLKKYGTKKILFNLKIKGIQPEKIDNTLISNETQYSNAYSLALKKLKFIGDKPNKKEKIFRYLLSKGYDYDLINNVLREIFNEFYNIV